MSTEATDPSETTDYDARLRELCVTTYGMTEVEADIAEVLHAACWCQSTHDAYAEDGARPYEGCGPWTEREVVRGLMAAARPVHTRQNAASLRAIAGHRLEHSTDALTHARAEGIREAARLLERGLEDEEVPDGDA